MQQLEGINTEEELVKKASALGIELREEQATEDDGFFDK